MSLKETARGGGRYDAKMSWENPNPAEQVIDYYTVKLNEEAKNVSGTSNSAVFNDVLLSDHYLASVQAFSVTGGASPEKIVRRLPRPPVQPANGLRHDDDDDDDRYHRLLHYASALLVFALCCAALIVAKRALRRCRRDAAAGDYAYKTAAVLELAAVGGGGSGGDHETAVLKVLDEADMLLDRKSVVVSDVCLGHGHFGVVRKGLVKTDAAEYPVAVKSLRDRPSGRDLDEFLGEILLMQKVGKHPNIVSMVGCCLDANRQCILVVEYCPLGDLQTYLRKVRLVKLRTPNEWQNYYFNLDKLLNAKEKYFGGPRALFGKGH